MKGALGSLKAAERMPGMRSDIFEHPLVELMRCRWERMRKVANPRKIEGTISCRNEPIT